MAKKRTNRDDELSGKSKYDERLLDIFATVEKGFEDQRERCDDQLDYWDIYNCKLTDRQYYAGNSRIFVPIVHSAIDARKTRFTNQVFPKTGRYVEVVSQDGEIPHAETALIEHYIAEAKLKTLVAPALCVAGDVEGQYNVYVGWSSVARHVVWKENRGVQVAGAEMPEIDEIEDIVEETILDERPFVEVLTDADVLILPTTVDTVDEALHAGGSVTVLRRWSKAKIQSLIDSDEIRADVGRALIVEMGKESKRERENTRKKLADAAGIRAGGKHVLVYETWMKLKVDGDMRLCRAYYGGENQILSAKLNPYWCDRCPVLSVPVKKMPGVLKGMSPSQPVAEMQYFANDMVNEGADSATYSMMPIIMTDPEKNPKVGTMILDLAAVWETSPKDTQFAQFPKLWQDAFGAVAAAKQEIFQNLNVNPSMMPQSSGGKAKRNQAEIANEQQVDILTTADAVGVLEEGILTPIVQRFAEYDAQFRNADLTIRQFGMLGVRAKMEQIPPLQMGKRYTYRWIGVEAARNAAQVQQQIAAANVIRGIPPQMYKGRSIDMTPLIELVVENAFGPRLAPQIFKDDKSQLSMEPEFENTLLEQGFDVPVSPMDNDAQHMQEHMQALQRGDPSGTIRVHMLHHQQQMQAKQQAQQQQQGGQTAPGTPGGAGPGVAGVPQPGAQPGNPHAAKGPPGQIGPEQMGAAGAVTMPRKM